MSMDGYDAGYLYECCLPDEATLSDPNQPSRPVQAVTVEGRLQGVGGTWH